MYLQKIYLPFSNLLAFANQLPQYGGPGGELLLPLITIFAKMNWLLAISTGHFAKKAYNLLLE